MIDVPLRCWCGQVGGVARDVSPAETFPFVCYCRDCQAFAERIERPDVLDAAGGTRIVQLAPARVRLTSGRDALRRIQLSAKVIRWYAGCCRTPIANTAARPGFPLIALIHSFGAIAPPLCRIYERSARGPLPPDAPPPPTLRLFLRRGALLLRWRLQGLHRPNPFFATSGASDR